MSGKLSDFYEEWAAHRAADSRLLDYVSRADEWKWTHLEPLVRATGLLPQSVLEFGCGSGEMLELVSRAFPDAELTGIDIAQGMIAMARRRLPHARFEVGDSGLLARGEMRSDLVLAVDILEHLEDPVRCAQDLGQAGDRVALKIPLEKRTIRLGLPRKARTGTEHMSGHIHFWSLADSRRLLERAGLEILVETCADPPEAIRYHPAIFPVPPPPKVGDVVGLLLAAHRSFDVALERWTCAHQTALHRHLFGSSHFVVARRRDGGNEARRGSSARPPS